MLNLDNLAYEKITHSGKKTKQHIENPRSMLGLRGFVCRTVLDFQIKPSEKITIAKGEIINKTQIERQKYTTLFHGN